MSNHPKLAHIYNRRYLVFLEAQRLFYSKNAKELNQSNFKTNLAINYLTNQNEFPLKPIFKQSRIFSYFHRSSSVTTISTQSLNFSVIFAPNILVIDKLPWIQTYVYTATLLVFSVTIHYSNF